MGDLTMDTTSKRIRVRVINEGRIEEEGKGLPQPRLCPILDRGVHGGDDSGLESSDLDFFGIKSKFEKSKPPFPPVSTTSTSAEEGENAEEMEVGGAIGVS
ncbi:hypothetical protein HAX54_031514 [Datura stramonium]|uniref:Uncharacterized protein n=1 Tax=Datura stramonium TaxID=4076 RepID=A0ABS8RGN5_DATST|nr:hypothetical protein [Datura stramonium]